MGKKPVAALRGGEEIIYTPKYKKNHGGRAGRVGVNVHRILCSRNNRILIYCLDNNSIRRNLTNKRKNIHQRFFYFRQCEREKRNTFIIYKRQYTRIK